MKHMMSINVTRWPIVVQPSLGRLILAPVVLVQFGSL